MFPKPTKKCSVENLQKDLFEQPYLNEEENILNYRYLILGGGMTAYAAIRGNRSLYSEGSIALVVFPAIYS